MLPGSHLGAIPDSAKALQHRHGESATGSPRLCFFISYLFRDSRSHMHDAIGQQKGNMVIHIHNVFSKNIHYKLKLILDREEESITYE
jgi:hypothetical protein